MPAHLVERGALHRQDAPVGIVGRVRAAQHVEGLLEIAVVGERAAVSGEHRLVGGVGDRTLFEHGDGLRALTGGAQRHSVTKGSVGIPGIGAVALAIDFGGAARIGIGSESGFGLRGQRTLDVGHGLAAAKTRGQDGRDGG